MVVALTPEGMGTWSYFNSFDAGDEYSDFRVNTMPAEPLAPEVASTSADIMLALWDRQHVPGVVGFTSRVSCQKGPMGRALLAGYPRHEKGVGSSRLVLVLDPVFNILLLMIKC